MWWFVNKSMTLGTNYMDKLCGQLVDNPWITRGPAVDELPQSTTQTNYLPSAMRKTEQLMHSSALSFHNDFHRSIAPVIPCLSTFFTQFLD